MTTRRSLVLSLPALALLGEALASAQNDKTSILAADTAKLEHNAIFNAKTLPVNASANGSTQHVVQGKLITGEGIELHNTVLLPDHAPHPPHQHVHAEFLLMREGTVDWLLNGQHVAAGPGDILYAASMELHGIRNVGTTDARYFVVAVGPNLKA